MANQNFRVKNGINVGTAVTITNNEYRIGNSILHSSGLDLGSGNILSNNINSTGIITASSFIGSLVGIASTASYATSAGIATYASNAGIATNAQGLTGTPNLNVGIITASSVIVGSAVTINSSGINVTGIATIATVDITAGEVDVTRIGTVNLNVTGIATIATVSIVGAALSSIIVSGISTLGTVKVSSGIITATSGIVTYFGDGNFLNLTSNPSRGIGIGTTGGVVGYAVTFIDFKGAGVSTTQYNSSTGIATIFFEGGGGGSGSIGIGSTFSAGAANGDLFFHIDYGRIFVYYDEVTLGIGTDEYWIDAAPFNVGIITSLTNVSFSPGSATTTSMFFVGDNQTGFFSPGTGQFTVVSSGSSVLNVNASGINVTGVITASNFVGNLTGTASTSTASATAFGLSGTPNLNVGVITASNFVGGGASFSNLVSNETRSITGSEKLIRSDGNTVSLVYNSSTGANVGFATNPTNNIALNVTGIPTSSDFDNQTVTFAVIVNNTGTARTCTSITLNGVSSTIKWIGGSLSASLAGVTTTNGYTIFSFVGINTVGSASTTSNYVVLGVANGGFW